MSYSTKDGDTVDVKCQLENFGALDPVLTWYNKSTGFELQGIPPQEDQRSVVSRSFSGIAEDPGVAPLLCVARMSNAGDVRCETQLCYFECKYSLRSPMMIIADLILSSVI